jgi:hypothetical protein
MSDATRGPVRSEVPSDAAPDPVEEGRAPSLPGGAEGKEKYDPWREVQWHNRLEIHVVDDTAWPAPALGWLYRRQNGRALGVISGSLDDDGRAWALALILEFDWNNPREGESEKAFEARVRRRVARRFGVTVTEMRDALDRKRVRGFWPRSEFFDAMDALKVNEGPGEVGRMLALIASQPDAAPLLAWWKRLMAEMALEISARMALEDGTEWSAKDAAYLAHVMVGERVAS